jgi:hypothetical protein
MLVPCESCGASISDQATACPQCGHPRLSSPHCPECGKSVPAKAITCPACGAPTPVTDGATRPQDEHTVRAPGVAMAMTPRAQRPRMLLVAMGVMVVLVMAMWFAVALPAQRKPNREIAEAVKTGTVKDRWGVGQANADALVLLVKRDYAGMRACLDAAARGGDPQEVRQARVMRLLLARDTDDAAAEAAGIADLQRLEPAVGTTEQVRGMIDQLMTKVEGLRLQAAQ